MASTKEKLFRALTIAVAVVTVATALYIMAFRLGLSDKCLGCVSGSVTSQGELIALIASADAALYQQKKNTLYQQSSYS